MVIESIQKKCWEKAVHCLSTSLLFKHRTDRLSRRLRTLDFIGIGFPALVGGSVLSIGLESTWVTPIAIGLATAAGIVQIVLSAASLSFRWADSFAYASASQMHNRSLYERFSSLAEMPPADSSIAQTRLELLLVEDQHRSDLDGQQAVTRSEMSRGMREALWNMGKECATCQKKPESITPRADETCANCSDFTLRSFDI